MIPYEEGDGGEDELVADMLSAQIIAKIGKIYEITQELKLLQLLQKREMERQEQND